MSNSNPKQSERSFVIDLQFVDTESLIQEVLRRSRAAIVILVPKSVEGEVYSSVLWHIGMPWECKGLAETARDTIKEKVYESTHDVSGE